MDAKCDEPYPLADFRVLSQASNRPPRTDSLEYKPGYRIAFAIFIKVLGFLRSKEELRSRMNFGGLYGWDYNRSRGRIFQWSLRGGEMQVQKSATRKTSCPKSPASYTEG